MVASSRKPITYEEFLERIDSDRLEVIDGEVVEKATPSADHSLAEIKLGVAVDPFNRKPGGRGPGGWWIFTEIHVRYARGEIYCHDAAGWRRDRLEARPKGWPITTRPDWVCEIVSPKHERTDLVTKPRVLHAAEVPHDWILDPVERILLVHRWSADGYIVVQRASAEETVRAEPFDAIELKVGVLLGDDDDSE
jgi:Uma2 family endonuclease